METKGKFLITILMLICFVLSCEGPAGPEGSDSITFNKNLIAKEGNAIDLSQNSVNILKVKPKYDKYKLIYQGNSNWIAHYGGITLHISGGTPEDLENNYQIAFHIHSGQDGTVTIIGGINEAELRYVTTSIPLPVYTWIWIGDDNQDWQFDNDSNGWMYGEEGDWQLNRDIKEIGTNGVHSIPVKIIVVNQEPYAVHSSSKVGGPDLPTL